jgi:hypothetical protein
MKKFKMELVWHNCYEYPPEETLNDNLIATDGKHVFKVKYDKNIGWFDLDNVRFLPFELLWEYWWADIVQTVQGCSDFK